MTKKRFQKLARAYFTRLNEWGKENGYDPLPMGKTYKALPKLANSTGKTRAEWWETVTKYNDFGVGIKTK